MTLMTYELVGLQRTHDLSDCALMHRLLAGRNTTSRTEPQATKARGRRSSNDGARAQRCPRRPP
jgi:hypothetical protein